MPAKPTTCVIGAGISGLTAGKALSDWGLPYTCFEASDDIGGNWYFGNPNGRSSAYQSLHIDTSRDGVSFRDMPMGPDEYPDYPTMPRSWATCTATRTRSPSVTGSVRDPGGARRAEAVRRLEHPSGEGSTEEFDFLVVGNGHHWDPRLPDFPGDFDGESHPRPPLHRARRPPSISTASGSWWSGSGTAASTSPGAFAQGRGGEGLDLHPQRRWVCRSTSWAGPPTPWSR